MKATLGDVSGCNMAKETELVCKQRREDTETACKVTSEISPEGTLGGQPARTSVTSACKDTCEISPQGNLLDQRHMRPARTGAAGLGGEVGGAGGCPRAVDAEAAGHDVVQHRAALHSRLDVSAEGLPVYVCRQVWSNMSHWWDGHLVLVALDGGRQAPSWTQATFLGHSCKQCCAVCR